LTEPWNECLHAMRTTYACCPEVNSSFVISQETINQSIAFRSINGLVFKLYALYQQTFIAVFPITCWTEYATVYWNYSMLTKLVYILLPFHLTCFVKSNFGWSCLHLLSKSLCLLAKRRHAAINSSYYGSYGTLARIDLCMLQYLR